MSAASEAGQDDAGGHHASGDGGRLGERGGRLGVALLGALPGLFCLLGPPADLLAQSAGAGLRLLTQPAGPGDGLLTQVVGPGTRLLAQMLPGLPRLRARSRSSICSGLNDPEPAAPAPSAPDAPAS